MTTVRFLNGSHDIEGNVAEIFTKSSRIIVDFGMVGGFKRDDVNKLIKSHILPNLPDLFSNKKSKFNHQAIVLTHIDIDNMNAAIYLNSDIKIYVSEQGFELYQELVTNNLIQPISANIKVLPDNLQVGDLLVKGYPSDCGVKGSQSLLISDGEHSFGISGNVRLNGPHKEQVYKWVRKFQKRRLDLFLFDSTSFSFNNDCQLYTTDENTLKNQFADLVVQRRDLIVVNVDAFNVDRLATIFKKCHHFERKMVLEQTYANVLHSFYPNLKLTVLAESVNKKETNSNQFEVVSLNDIKTAPRKYVLQNSFGNINFLKELSSGLYLHSNGFPKVSLDRDFESLRESLSKNDFQYIDFSASGHASKKDLIFLVDAVNSKKTVPWHSYHPELAIKAMGELDTKFVMPRVNKKITFK